MQVDDNSIAMLLLNSTNIRSKNIVIRFLESIRDGYRVLSLFLSANKKGRELSTVAQGSNVVPKPLDSSHPVCSCILSVFAVVKCS